MKDFFEELFEYTFHFNNQILELLQGQIPEKSLALINHTLNAHEIWNARILEKQPATGVWDIRPCETLNTINANNYRQSLDILNYFDLGLTIEYKNSRGDIFKNTVKDMLFQAINHSTYHRGQIATDCKLHGIKPLVTDYIFYKRV